MIMIDAEFSNSDNSLMGPFDLSRIATMTNLNKFQLIIQNPGCLVIIGRDSAILIVMTQKTLRVFGDDVGKYFEISSNDDIVTITSIEFGLHCNLESIEWYNNEAEYNFETRLAYEHFCGYPFKMTPGNFANLSKVIRENNYMYRPYDDYGYWIFYNGTNGVMFLSAATRIVIGFDDAYESFNRLMDLIAHEQEIKSLDFVTHRNDFLGNTLSD